MSLPEGSKLLFAEDEIETAIDRVAVRITLDLADRNPLLLCLMNGALPFTWDLMRRLRFDLELDYLHLTRYRGTAGGEVRFLRRTTKNLADRTVLLIDDVLDEGFTLKAAIDDLAGLGAGSVATAVLIDKRNARKVPIDADYVALEAPNRYLVGRGMDHDGLHRNLPAIYTLGQV